MAGDRIEAAGRPARRLDGAGGRGALLRLAPRRRRRARDQDRAPGGRLRARLRHRRRGPVQLLRVAEPRQGKRLSSTSRTRTDKALLERLVAKADVFIQNLAPGAMARAGFGSAALRARHPRLITVDISGYGEERRLRADEGLRPAGAGRERPVQRHRPGRGPRARRRLGLRHRLRHERPRRGAGGADRARRSPAAARASRSACSTAWRTG